MKYICLGYIEPGKFEAMTESERHATFDECFEYNDHLRANGHLVAEVPLQPPETALTLYWKNVNRPSDARLPLDISQSEIRIGDEPAFCRYLVLDEVVFRPGTTNPWPAFPRRVDDVQIVWDQSDEVVD